MDAMLKNVLLGVVAPAVACAAVLALAWRPWRAAAQAGGRWGMPVGLGVCFALALGVSVAWDWPGFPPNASWLWLAYLVPAACLWGVIECVDRVPESVRVGGRLGMAGLTGWLIAFARMDDVWVWRATGCVLVALLALGLPRLANRTRGASMPIVLCGSMGATAVLAVLAENARLSQIAGAMALGLAAAIVLAWWRPALVIGRGAVAPIAVAIPGLLLSAHYGSYAGIPAWAFLVAALAPLAAWVGEIGPVARLRPWLRTLVRVTAVVVPVAAALATAYLTTMDNT